MLKAYGGKRKGRYYQVNNDALQAFQRRRDSGMNLSQKLWNQAEDYKRGLEHTLSVAIEKGMSAVTLSKRVSKYLEDFPSMKKDYGERFGRATDIHDCEYRSIRLARSEINMAYRSAEQMRWEQMDFIIGYEVKLSGNHNCKGVPQGAFYDICDDLKGRYPKDFKWLGWHPNCRCYVVPIIKSEERFWEDEDKRGDDNEEITELPDNFKQWAVQNKDRIDKAESRGTQPYFVRDNRERVKQAIKQGEVMSLVEQYKSIKPKTIDNPLSQTMAVDVTGGAATGVAEGFTALVNAYYKAEANKQKVAILNQIISDSKFARLDYHSPQNGSIFGMGIEEFSSQLRVKEMPKNLTIAKKLADNGYDVFLLANPNTTKSADFILRKGKKLYYVEGKTMNGTNSLDNLLNNGSQQADIVVVDVIGTNDVRYLTKELKSSFERNDNLSKVMLLKGGRIVEFNRRAALSKRFESSFKKTWNKNK